MSKWNELKSWAEAVIGLNKTNLWDWVASVEDGRLGKTHTLFALAANPAAILELITENERNERMLLAACVDMGAIGEALGADMNSDGEELLSMVVDMKAENERLERKNANQCETIRHYQDQINGGDTSLTMLIAERDQMRELLMRLVDLQNSGRGPIRSYELWNDVVNQARPLLGLEVRHV